jgi:hypothetical protein
MAEDCRLAGIYKRPLLSKNTLKTNYCLYYPLPSFFVRPLLLNLKHQGIVIREVVDKLISLRLCAQLLPTLNPHLERLAGVTFQIKAYF